MAELDENCNASPTSGCSDGQISTAIAIFTDVINNKLISIVSQKSQIVTDIENCKAHLQFKLDEIISKMQTLISNSEDCCDEITENMQNIIGVLEDKIYNEEDTSTTQKQTTTSSTTTTKPATTTSSTTTTIKPTTTTSSTTTIPSAKSGLFYVDVNDELLCLEENGITLYYMGTWGEGIVMYTSAGMGTPLTGYSFIKKPSPEVARYTLNPATGQVGVRLMTDCE